MSISQRIASIKSALEAKTAFACIIPSTDPHMSEYVAPRWEGRAWASGFKGSAGTLVVTRSAAALWTDGRYFLEAGEVLKGTGIELMKMGLPETADIETWLADGFRESGGSIGDVLVAGESFPLARFREIEGRLKASGMKLSASADILDEVWKDRPGLPGGGFYETSVELTGEDREARISRLRDWIGGCGCSHALVTALDEIAWILNLRGSDVECNPVFYAYLLVGQNEARIYTHGGDLSRDIRENLEKAGIEIRDYGTFFDELGKLDASVAADPATLNIAAADILGEKLTEPTLPLRLWKALKTSEELQSTRGVMERDGVAMVRFLHWLEQSIVGGEEDGSVIDELAVSAKLTELRSADGAYVGDSFPAIVGYRGHGAIVHYRVDENSSVPLEGSGLLLVDSGGQYADGTTDITRTVGIRGVTPEQIDHFTLVLKGNIKLSRAVFPRGTTGLQLDALARLDLWNQGLDYAHGTGHGVGFALNVHEGPQSISPRFIHQSLEPGMILSNEPGFYSTGSHGIRIENLEAVVGHPEYPGFLKFETLTLCPIELELINRSLLDEGEKAWINDYHQMVWKRLSPLLEPDLRLWLQHKTRKL